MVVKLTQKQADYIKSFRNDKKLAFYHIGRWGFGYNLKDGNGKVYVNNNEEAPFTYEEKEKMLEAVINGYEVVVPKFIFHTFSDITNLSRLYYAGKSRQLTANIARAKKIEQTSEEYKALELLGFLEEEV